MEDVLKSISEKTLAALPGAALEARFAFQELTFLADAARVVDVLKFLREDAAVLVGAAAWNISDLFGTNSTVGAIVIAALAVVIAFGLWTLSQRNKITAADLDQLLASVEGDFEPSTWQAFIRFAVEGRPAAQVAGELGVTESAVVQAKFRVLKRLREQAGELLD